MAYIAGLVLFALGILISVSLHEAGHMGTAKMFGMRVTRYFVGFGPTLWSFRRGETEYGVKGIPLGGFVKITGMTPLEEQEEEVPEKDRHRVFWRKPLWQRTVVLAAGSMTHFVLGFIILWVLVSFVGIGNPEIQEAADESQETATVAIGECIAPSNAPLGFECGPEDQPTPARAAGMQDGDRVVAVNGTPVSNWDQMADAIQPLPTDRPSQITVLRDGGTIDLSMTPYADDDGDGGTVAKIGVGPYVDPAIPDMVTYGPIDGVGAAGDTTGDLAVATVEALKRFPQKVPALWNSITGEERDPDTPVSVVGASRLGGELVEYDQWALFFFLLASLNYFVGFFNLLPLLPLDGGHIAVAWYERARSWVAAKRGRPDPGRVDYMKLMPLTYLVLIVFGGFMLLTITADVVNPITLFE